MYRISEDRLQYDLTDSSRFIGYGYSSMIHKGFLDGKNVFLHVFKTNLMKEIDKKLTSIFENMAERLCSIRDTNLVPVLGWTVVNMSRDYILIYEDAGKNLNTMIKDGTWRNYTFNEKIKFFLNIAETLVKIGGIHNRIIRPQNFFEKSIINDCYRSDFVDKFLINNKDLSCICTVNNAEKDIGYLPPENILYPDDGFLPTEKSDVYAFSILMNKALTNNIDEVFNISRKGIINIFLNNNSFRPKLFTGNIDISRLICQGWDTLPENRPTMEDFCRRLRDFVEE